jgi:hypothetical protein
MPDERVAKSIYKWKTYATRPKGRPRLRWEDDVENDLRKMGVRSWRQWVQDRIQWKEIIEQAKTHKELKKRRKRDLVNMDHNKITAQLTKSDCEGF